MHVCPFCEELRGGDSGRDEPHSLFSPGTNLGRKEVGVGKRRDHRERYLTASDAFALAPQTAMAADRRPPLRSLICANNANGPERQIFFLRQLICEMFLFKDVSGNLSPDPAKRYHPPPLKLHCITETPAGPILDNNPISTCQCSSQTGEIGLFALLTCGASQSGGKSNSLEALLDPIAPS